MKLVIGCLNSKYIHASLSPWCLLAGANEFCKSEFCATVCESTINADLDEFAANIPDADVYAFSCYIWNIEQTLYVCKVLKERTTAQIILGGPEVAYRAQDVLQKYDFVDFVLSGEGEFNTPKLIDALNFKSDFANVDGLTYREGKEILSTPENQYDVTPPNPYTQEFLDNLKGRICYIETSRGCPYRCAFCLSGRCGGLRYFDMDTVKQNILLLANSGTKTVKFVDRTFNANYRRANEILLFIKENYGTKIPSGVCFHFEIAGDILHEETLAILKEMPHSAVQLEIGMQSFNEQTLKTINRKTDTQKLIKNIKTLLSFQNMHIHIDLIAGLTGEDLQSFKNSFNIGYNLKAHMLQMGFLKLLYGSDMREHTDKYPCDFSDTPPYEVTSTPWL
ncbi:MAG: B12-binding domain-containing radical SAM protein, partial [Clostridia bacterium]|nr:B12-binding domain-containing radical SAM protein [Clostridia bacterium]